MRSNPLYKLMNLKMGGELVQVFEEQGADGLKEYSRVHIQQGKTSIQGNTSTTG